MQSKVSLVGDLKQFVDRASAWRTSVESVSRSFCLSSVLKLVWLLRRDRQTPTPDQIGPLFYKDLTFLSESFIST